LALQFPGAFEDTRFQLAFDFVDIPFGDGLACSRGVASIGGSVVLRLLVGLMHKRFLCPEALTAGIIAAVKDKTHPTPNMTSERLFVAKSLRGVISLYTTI
jgi:hypothetical protein